jgi:hypothetical protein
MKILYALEPHFPKQRRELSFSTYVKGMRSDLSCREVRVELWKVTLFVSIIYSTKFDRTMSASR